MLEYLVVGVPHIISVTNALTYKQKIAIVHKLMISSRDFHVSIIKARTTKPHEPKIAQ